MERIPPTLGPPTPGTEPPLEPITVERRPEPELPQRPVRWGRWLLLVLALPVIASHLIVLALRWMPPPTTAFMLQSPTQPVQYRWVPATATADVLRKAVVASEDQKFWDHGGFDFEAIEKAVETNRTSKRKRGASTISQQVAKNVFLWQGRSWMRKGLEVYATLLIEWVWGKDRILEVYLNVAEFGPGVYGAQAAAQKFFGKSAATLTPEEAARLAAVLPSPRRWRAGSPGPYVQARADWILGQMGYRKPEPEPEPPAGDLPTDPGAAPPNPSIEPSIEPGAAPDINTTPVPVEPSTPPADATQEPEGPDEESTDAPPATPAPGTTPETTTPPPQPDAAEAPR